MDVDPSICHCPCHRPGVVCLHIVACCYGCAHCGARIKLGMHEEHLGFCPNGPSVLTPAEIMRACGMEPNRWQDQLYSDCSSRNRVDFLMPRGQGATTAGLVLALHAAIAARDEQILFFAPDRVQFEDLLVRLLSIAKSLPFDHAAFVSRREFRFRQGSSIRLMGFNPMRFQGYRPRLAIVDRWGMASEEFRREVGALAISSQVVTLETI